MLQEFPWLGSIFLLLILLPRAAVRANNMALLVYYSFNLHIISENQCE